MAGEKKQNGRMMECIAKIPYKIIERTNSGAYDGLSTEILDDLCLSCLDLSQAAFLAHNKDFKCCNGVAGFSRSSGQDVFNKRVQEYALYGDTIDYAACAQELGFKDPGLCVIPLKHGNQGVFLYEKNPSWDQEVMAMLPYVVSFLGICPLF
jgi:hypothetical protein